VLGEFRNLVKELFRVVLYAFFKPKVVLVQNLNDLYLVLLEQIFKVFGLIKFFPVFLDWL
jgi:hypothetical protein